MFEIYCGLFDRHEGNRVTKKESHFATIIPGLHLVFQDKKLVTPSDWHFRGKLPTWDIQVCGPGALKDAYDLYYLAKNVDPGDIASRLCRLSNKRKEPNVNKAIDIMENDFKRSDAIGPVSVSEFLRAKPNNEVRADVSRSIKLLLFEFDSQCLESG